MIPALCAPTAKHPPDRFGALGLLRTSSEGTASRLAFSLKQPCQIPVLIRLNREAAGIVLDLAFRRSTGRSFRVDYGLSAWSTRSLS